MLPSWVSDHFTNYKFKNAFSDRLAPFGLEYHDLFVPDFMHEFELGVFKQTFIHLLRILFAAGGDSIQMLNERYVLVNISFTSMYSIVFQIPVHTSLWEGYLP
ncbi:MAG TPA: hypothetical protein VGO47_05200 [Chlamydiales bacterium]|nr:hypothetical protein [Chlamydiales bacterium]